MGITVLNVYSFPTAVGQVTPWSHAFGSGSLKGTQTTTCPLHTTFIWLATSSESNSNDGEDKLTFGV